MSAALDHPMIGPVTIKDWLAMDPPRDGSRLELIFGHLHVSPAPSGEHQAIAFELAVLLRDQLRAARPDLHVVPAVNVEISTAWRTALIPDVVVLDRPRKGVSFPPESVVLVVEVWSPGNVREERETKLAGYAAAGVPFVWAIDQASQLRALTLTAYRLDRGQYVTEDVVTAGQPATITAAPVPITLDLAHLDD
jgi:Uma2 family endonuclease